MKLQLDDTYQIVTDSHNYVLQRYEDIRDRKTGEVTRKDWKDVGYYGTNIAPALLRYTQESIKGLDVVDIDKVYATLKDLKETILTVVKKENIQFPAAEGKGKKSE